MGKYILNPETLLYEIKEVSLKSKVFKGLLLFAGSVAMAVLYLWLFTSVLGYDLPKTAFLKAEHADKSKLLDIVENCCNLTRTFPTTAFDGVSFSA